MSATRHRGWARQYSVLGLLACLGAPACGSSAKGEGEQGGTSSGGSAGSSTQGGAAGTSANAGTGGQAAGGQAGTQPVASPSAADLARQLGTQSVLLVGLGGVDAEEIQTQGIQVALYERYLVGVGVDAWPYWNQPDGAYVDRVVGAAATELGAVPMFTLYQMATAGDGNISAVIGDDALMSDYWAQTKLLFARLAIYDKPALVNVEPDFWGYAMFEAPAQDPAQLTVKVSLEPDCADLPDDLGGYTACVLRLAQAAPKAFVGFSPSDWGFGTDAVVAFMKDAGADRGAFVVMQTLDGDAGCFEAKANDKCSRGGSGWYWDESNTTSPNFHEHLAEAKKYHDQMGLPLIWWQTPLGVPAASPGGTVNHFRDNRAHYFLTHASELVAAGGLGITFSPGDDQETTLYTDGGQFRELSAQYWSAPAPLE